jgi:hypothetical protein
MTRYRYERIKKFSFPFNTKREALLFQKSLREKLFHSLSVYDFRGYVYSRRMNEASFHWETKVMSDNSLQLSVTIVKMKAA